MKKYYVTAIAIVLGLGVIAAMAGQSQMIYFRCMKYVHDNGGDISEVKSGMTYRKNFNDIKILKWDVDGVAKPTLGDLPSVADTKVWATNDYPDIIAGANANPQKWTARERAMVLVLAKEINVVRTNAGLPAISNAELKQKLKKELKK